MKPTKTKIVAVQVQSKQEHIGSNDVQPQNTKDASHGTCENHRRDRGGRSEAPPSVVGGPRPRMHLHHPSLVDAAAALGPPQLGYIRRYCTQRLRGRGPSGTTWRVHHVHHVHHARMQSGTCGCTTRKSTSTTQVNNSQCDATRAKGWVGRLLET
jgi:hypothetical protein